MSNSKPHFNAEDVQKTGDDCTVKFSPRNFNIVWGNDTRYWEIPPKESTGPAKLLQVSWLEVTGSTTPLDAGKYEIMFDIEMKAEAFGWQGCPLFMMAKVGKKGRYTWKRLTVPTAAGRTQLPSGSEKFEIEVKSATNDDERKLYFGLYEVWTGKWKGGMEIYGATVEKKS